EEGGPPREPPPPPGRDRERSHGSSLADDVLLLAGCGRDRSAGKGRADRPGHPTRRSFSSSAGVSSFPACEPMRRPRLARAAFLTAALVGAGTPPSSVASPKP